MTTPAEPAPGAAPATYAPAPVTRDPDLVLAHIHLRLGSLALARAELEALAGRDALDDDGLMDLAEVRWRTGDVAGAADAAAAVMPEDAEGSPAIALIITAEAALERGRPTEARRFADLAIARAGSTLDALFAGMPRGAVWPADALAPDLPSPTLFDAPARSSSVAPAAADAADVVEPPATSSPVSASLTIPLWAASDELGPSGPPSIAEPPEGPEALALGEAALADGDLDEAATQLGLALRLTPALAPTIIGLLGDREDRRLALVLGDAYRLVGREDAARRAYALAARRPSPSPTPSPDPREGESA